MKFLSLTCSSSACERNWSAFEQVHTKKRSRLLHDRMSDLVFIKFNSRMKHKRENKSRDPIEKTIVDVLEDEDNEFITGIVGNDNVVEHVGDEDQTQQERASTSQEQGKKKKRPTAPPRKKRKKSLQSLLNSVDEEAILSASSNSSSSESEDESPSALADSD
ncbi:craniofacial development protein 1 [Triticum aestivum]|uniref:craniofacial development protein 1 n=1 Tax=Triticum aestivum TaxID=4565 RepID=UPI001D001DD6|nr:craniofacial development protein 1-like [Triticum aestivum]